eukprot:2837797-Amphidinium_carterae.1
MQKNEYLLWETLEGQHGKLVENEDYVEAFNTKDDGKIKTVCYKYIERHRELRDQWREERIAKDTKKIEAKMKRDEERQQAEKRKRDQEVQEATAQAVKTKRLAKAAKPTTAPQTASATATSSTRPPIM